MELLNPNIISYTWATKPSTAPLGEIICVTDVGENGSLWRGNGVSWIRLSAFRIYSATTTAEVTAITSETTLLTIPVNGGVIGANGKLIIHAIFSFTNNANQKILRFKYNSTVVWTATATTGTTVACAVPVHNINSEAVQKIATGVQSGYGLTSSAVLQTAVDTSVDFNVVVTGRLADSADTLRVEAIFIEVL